jgi:DNA-binding CsgD family transcriptional regulator
MNPELQERIHTLWDELADMDATRSDAVADHVMIGLCELVEAQNAVWVGSVHLGGDFPDDPVKGWRAPVVRYLYPTRSLEGIAREQAKDLHRGVADATTIANVAGAGRFRANRLRDLVPDEWFSSDFYQHYYLGMGRSDAVFVAFPVNEDAESWFGVFREVGKPAFTADERDTLAYALRGIKWFHRQLMLSHGLLIASKPLTPAERRVLQLLLSRASEKEISHNLGLTANSVHQYVVSVFRKFGVNSRAALMSLWLGAT